MERKIGEIFEYNGEWYQCVESQDGSCKHCDMNFEGKCPIPIKECTESGRSDKSYVIFKKLEKVGEPYEYLGMGIIMVQEYILANANYIWEYSQDVVVMDCQNGKVAIELKQNKEDMEENKTTFPKEDNALTRTVYAYVNGKISDKELIKSIKEMSDEYPYNKNNLKPFSLELVKQGNPVCTRDGRKARIICFDRRLFYKNVSYPILALVERSDGEDDVCCYNEKGKVLIEDGAEYKDDLMMLPEKKEGWVNVYKERCYESKEEAISCRACNMECIDTIRLEWEE